MGGQISRRTALRRVGLKRKTEIKRRGRLRRVSRKRAAVSRRVATAKQAWKDGLQTVCWVCGATESIVTHHMLRGHLARLERNDKPWAWFRICDACHDDHWHNTPPAEQLAIKRHFDPDHYSREAYLRARNGNAMEYVTPAEVDAAAVELGYSGE